MGIDKEVPTPDNTKNETAEIKQLPVASAPDTQAAQDPAAPLPDVTVKLSFQERLMLASGIAGAPFDDSTIDISAQILELIQFDIDDNRSVRPQEGEARFISWQENAQTGQVGFDAGTAKMKPDRETTFNHNQYFLTQMVIRRMKISPIPSIVSLRKKFGISAPTKTDKG